MENLRRLWVHLPRFPTGQMLLIGVTEEIVALQKQLRTQHHGR